MKWIVVVAVWLPGAGESHQFVVETGLSGIECVEFVERIGPNPIAYAAMVDMELPSGSSATMSCETDTFEAEAGSR